ncbi:MAG TPA: hypothetical protein VFY92_06570 [Hyphomicrobiaceae bacterium]|nr:hypothetical protein [Hyphomicrobiaceae bacterium]
MHHLGGVITILSGLLVALAPLAALIGHRLHRKRCVLARGIVQDVPRLDRETEWERVVSRARSALAHAPRVAELHEKATVKIESAEHAYNRLVLECARLCHMPIAPTLEPMRQLPHNTVAVAEQATADERPADQQPLAA